MPIIRKMEKDEYLKIVEETTDASIDQLMELLAKVLAIYKSKRGTYKDSYWKAINERKIKSSIECIESLIDYYNRFDSLSPGQIELARKMIKNGFILL